MKEALRKAGPPYGFLPVENLKHAVRNLWPLLHL